MSDTPAFRFSLFRGLVEVASNKDLPPQLVDALSAALVTVTFAIAVGIIFWGLSKLLRVSLKEGSSKPRRGDRP